MHNPLTEDGGQETGGHKRSVFGYLSSLFVRS